MTLHSRTRLFRRGGWRFLSVLTLWPLMRTLHGAAVLEEDYNQWKQALGTNFATAAEHITSAPGFKVELIRSAPRNEGSWVAMAFDPRGRIVIAR